MKSPHELEVTNLLGVDSIMPEMEAVPTDSEKNDENVRLKQLAFEGLKKVAKVNPIVKPAEQMNYIFPGRSTH